jgi:quinol-cytochrome oxidoreductase complex cytochrome b subunit
LLVAGSFILAYIVLQVVSGLLLTSFYTPEFPSEAAGFAIPGSAVAFEGENYRLF